MLFSLRVLTCSICGIRDRHIVLILQSVARLYSPVNIHVFGQADAKAMIFVDGNDGALAAAIDEDADRTYTSLESGDAKRGALTKALTFLKAMPIRRDTIALSIEWKKQVFKGFRQIAGAPFLLAEYRVRRALCAR